MRYGYYFAIIALSILTSCLSTDNDEETTTIVSSGSSSDTPQDALTKHNQIRLELFSDSPMVWDESIAASSQEYANYLASTGKLEHDGSSGYGENLFAASYGVGYSDAIESWYSEKNYYDYASNSCSSVCGHYTQMIWKDSTQLGCGKATYTTGSYQGGTVIICRYNPPGNYIGERPY